MFDKLVTMLYYREITSWIFLGCSLAVMAICFIYNFVIKPTVHYLKENLFNKKRRNNK